MITRIQVRNYKSLRYADVPLKGFHVLVGPNASGKSAFLDVISFLHDFISEDLEYAVKKRTDNFFDLVWGRGEKEQGFEIAVEAHIPHRYFNVHEGKSLLRYELAIQYLHEKNEFSITEERCFHCPNIPRPPYPIMEPYTLISDNSSIEIPFLKRVINSYNNEYSYEIEQGTHVSSIDFPNSWKRSGFSILSDDNYEPNFLWFIRILKYKIQFFYFDHFVMRKGCTPGTGAFLKHDGSNLPWVIDDLKKNHPERFKEWLNHIRTALPHIEDIRAFRRPEDGFCFLMFKFTNAPELPSWAVSDGTLRLLALTLPAYLPDAKGIYMFEEPENGIHPQAIETVMDSLKSFYNGQVLITTHSPLILSLVKPEDILCFSNHPERGTAIITGDNHPVLQEWKKHKETSLGVLFASGIFDSEWGDDERSDCTGS